MAESSLRGRDSAGYSAPAGCGSESAAAAPRRRPSEPQKEPVPPMKLRMSAWCALVVATSAVACGSTEVVQGPPTLAPASATPPVDNTASPDKQDAGPA